MKKQLLYWLVFGTLIVVGCQKEQSFEGSSTPSDGSLQADASGDCLPKTVNGVYLANTALVTTTNTITVAVNVRKTGSYLAYTDTVNGYYFRTSGIFTATGVTNITLRGSGTPFSAGVNNFIVNYDSTQCDLAVTVLPAGTGSAVFTLAGAPTNCTGATVQGTYATGVALNPATNVVAITTNVTTIGTYTITTTYQGMTFAATGAFTTTGLNTVTLQGTGTPTTGGANVVPLTAGTSTCSFTVAVSAPATGTLTCASLAVQGTYTAGTAVGATNLIQIPVNFTSMGAYTISSNTVDGLSFTTTGNAAATGTQTITVPATGTPGTAGTKNFTLSLNGSATGTCSFTVTVVPAAGGAIGTLGGAPNVCTPAVVAGTYTIGTPMTAGNTVQLSITATQAGSYSISSGAAVSGITFAGSGTAVVGPQNITLVASGTPSGTAGTKTFTVTFGTSSCTFTVNLQAAAGGAAVGTLGGAPNVCTPATVNGTYYVSTATTGSNTVQVQLNVTTAGTYSISTNTVNGMSFSGSGTVATGAQTITLNATGTPTSSGSQTFTVTWGTSTCTFVVNVLSNDYFPRTTGSNWSYENDNDPNDSLYRNVIAATHSAIGNTYNIFMSNNGTGPDSSGYYRKNGGDYLEWIDIAGYIGFDPPAQWAEYIFLKDNVAVGQSWNSAGVTGTFTGMPYTLRFKYSIDQKDVPISVTTSLGTVTYQNVIVVKEEYEQFVGGIWVNLTSTVGYGKSYYAKGIGLIKYEAFDSGNVSQFLQELRRYQVQ